MQMIRRTPTERIEWLLSQSDVADAHAPLRLLLEQYKFFLATTNIPEKELIERFLNNEIAREYMGKANALGQSVFDALQQIGKGSRLHRLLIV